MIPKINFKTKIFNLFRSLIKIRFVEHIFCRFTKKSSSGSIFFKWTPNPYQYSKNDIRYETRKGINYCLHMNDAMDWFIYFDFQESSKENMFKLIKPGYNIIDIGANIGETTLNFAKLTGKEGNVLSLEPDNGNFKKLISNLKLNNFINIKALKIGAGDKPGFFNLITPEGQNTGMMRIREQSSENDNIIEVATLDSIIEKEKVTNVDFIKIDVEGYELKVLKGAEETLKKFRPILFIELDNENLKEQGSSANELIMFFEEKNVQMKRVDDDKEIFSNMNFEKCHYDIVCLPKDEII